MIFNDGSSYRVVTDPAAQLAQRELYCFRVASARDGVPYIDTAALHHRTALADMPALLMYQFVWQNAGTPESQAQFFIDCLGGELYDNEMVMLDIESGGGITDPADFTRRWLAVVEDQLDCRAWVYVPSALAGRVTRSVTSDRIIMAPRYSGTAARGLAPTWPHDVHQYTDKGPFPGCTQSGDTNYTNLTVEQMLARTKGTPMAWRVAKSLDRLLAQLNAAAPNRSKVSDGAIGDAAHAARTSDHNPWVKIGALGIVTARDFTHDPANGADCNRLVADLVASGDRRIKYIIWNRRIWNRTAGWRPYTGSNPHVKHFHLSVESSAALFDNDAAWNVFDGAKPAPSVNDPNDDVLELGDAGPAVRALQETLNRWYPKLAPLLVDGELGDATVARVKHFQGLAGLAVDGQVGPASRAILGLKPPAEYKDAPPAPPAPPVPAVGGAIGVLYDRLPQDVKDALGPVQTPELPTADQQGRFNHFAGGSIYWHPTVGPYVVRGGIRGVWEQHAWETGPLGYPTSHEFVVDSLSNEGLPVRWIQQNFLHGYIVWRDVDGVGVATVAV